MIFNHLQDVIHMLNSHEREIGNDLLTVQGLSKTIDGEKVLDNISFTMNPNDKAILIGDSEIAKTTLLKILAGEMEPDEGTFKWGVTTSLSYFLKITQSSLKA